MSARASGTVACADLVEGRSSGSVQVGPPYLTYTKDGAQLNYTVWGFVSPYFGAKPAEDAVYFHTQGRTADGLDDLVERQRTLYGSGASLVRFEGKAAEYPYTEGSYAGPTVADVKRLKGTTVRLKDGKPAPIAEALGLRA